MSQKSTNKHKWTDAESSLLIELYAEGVPFHVIPTRLDPKQNSFTEIQCRLHLDHLVKSKPTKTKYKQFTPKTDELLLSAVNTNRRPDGKINWKAVQIAMGENYNIKQLKNRYDTYLKPLINTPFTPEEDSQLKQKFEEYGTKWRKIAQYFPSRNESQLKNRLYQLSKPASQRNNTPVQPTQPAADQQTAATPTDESSLLARIPQAIDQANDYNETQDNNFDLSYLNDPNWNPFDDPFGGFDFS